MDEVIHKYGAVVIAIVVIAALILLVVVLSPTVQGAIETSVTNITEIGSKAMTDIGKAE